MAIVFVLGAIPVVLGVWFVVRCAVNVWGEFLRFVADMEYARWAEMAEEADEMTHDIAAMLDKMEHAR